MRKLKDNYQYPLNYDWSNEEMAAVIHLYNEIEKAYEKGVQLDELKDSYRRFKEIVPSIGEEKQLGNAFEKESGYSLYKVMQQAKIEKKKILKMEAEKWRK